MLTEAGSGKGGRGYVLQDVNASEAICMSKIRDLTSYHKYIPTVKKVTMYDEKKLFNGTIRSKAQFDVSVFRVGFRYFIDLTYIPKYNTLTWTLDYSRNSDFDDSIGHWQVMKHPSKNGWSRVLYSCNIKLFPWIPGFVVTFLTKTALVESTTWVKKQSEIEQAKEFIKPGLGWFTSQVKIPNVKDNLFKVLEERKEEISRSWKNQRGIISTRFNSLFGK